MFATPLIKSPPLLNIVRCVKCLQCHKVRETSLRKAKHGGDCVKFKHKCSWEECPFCEKQVQWATHQCFIQPIDPKDDEPKLHKVHTSQVGSQTVVRVDEDGDMWVESRATSSF